MKIYKITKVISFSDAVASLLNDGLELAFNSGHSHYQCVLNLRTIHPMRFSHRAHIIYMVECATDGGRIQHETMLFPYRLDLLCRSSIHIMVYEVHHFRNPFSYKLALVYVLNCNLPSKQTQRKFVPFLWFLENRWFQRYMSYIVSFVTFLLIRA